MARFGPFGRNREFNGPILGLNCRYYFCQVRAPETVFLKILTPPLRNTKIKTISKKVCRFGCLSCFSLPSFALKTAIFGIKRHYFFSRALALNFFFTKIITCTLVGTKFITISRKVCWFGCQSGFNLPIFASFWL